MFITLRHFHIEKPSVIVCHEVKSSVIAWPYTIFAHIPLISVVHDDPFAFEYNPNDPYFSASRFMKCIASLILTSVLNNSDTVIATTDKIAKRVKRKTTANNIISIPYGIDISLPRNPFCKRTHLLSIATWSQFRQPERYLDFIPSESSQISLIMAGYWQDDALKNQFIKSVRNRNLQDKVKIVEDFREEELLTLFESAIVFLRFGFNESGTGQGLFEAVGHGCPIITNPEIGGADILLDGVHGFIIDPKDTKLVRQKIMDIMTSQALWEELSRNCLKLATSKGWHHYLCDFQTSILASLTS